MLRPTPVLLLTLLLAPFLVGCDGGTAPAPGGDVRGIVMVDGTTLEGVGVELTGPAGRSATTDASGRYHFSDLPTGAYVVSVRQVPSDASFPATSRTAVVSGAQTVTVDFLGSFVRTGSIRGTVQAGTRRLGGVTVLLRGAESRSTVTDPLGFFSFFGLRSGSYEVELSGVPGSVTFPSIRTDVSLETGETHLVTFEGLPDLTASVVIRSIVRRTVSGGQEPANPQDLRGEFDVTLTVDRGDNIPESVTLFLGQQMVAQQFFAIGGGSAGLDGGDPPQAVPPFDLTFTVNSAEFDPATGQPRFLNGERLLTARLATLEGGIAAWESSVPVRLRNLDTVTGTVTPETGPFAGEDGEDWFGGGLLVRVLPVLYDPSRTVASVTAELRRVGGSQQRTITAEGSAPFTIEFSGEDPAAPGHLVGYQTPLGAADQLRIVSARYTTGETLPGLPVVLASELRIDNLPPSAGFLNLPRQQAGTDCCLANGGPDFSTPVGSGRWPTLFARR